LWHQQNSAWLTIVIDAQRPESQPYLWGAMCGPEEEGSLGIV
jgi:hypothetical protein